MQIAFPLGIFEPTTFEQCQITAQRNMKIQHFTKKFYKVEAHFLW